MQDGRQMSMDGKMDNKCPGLCPTFRMSPKQVGDNGNWKKVRQPFFPRTTSCPFRHTAHVLSANQYPSEPWRLSCLNRERGSGLGGVGNRFSSDATVAPVRGRSSLSCPPPSGLDGGEMPVRGGEGGGGGLENLVPPRCDDHGDYKSYSSHSRTLVCHLVVTVQRTELS